MNIGSSFGFSGFAFNYGILGHNRLNSDNVLPNAGESKKSSFADKLWNNQEQIADFEKQITNNSSKSQQTDSMIFKSNSSLSSSELHTLHTQLDEDCEKLVGAVCDCVSGESFSVFKPKNFDEENPVYKVKTWDQQGNVEERSINLSEVDPKNSDYCEMFAYSSYLSDSGKYPDAQANFMMAKGVDDACRDFNGIPRNDFYGAKANWLEVVKKAMDMQFDCGNKAGFLKFKGFFDYLNNNSSDKVVS